MVGNGIALITPSLARSSLAALVSALCRCFHGSSAHSTKTGYGW